MSDAPAPTGLAAWFARNRKIAAFTVGITLFFLCPYLPGPFAGICRIVATTLRTGTFDGQAIPWSDAPDAGQ